MTIINTSVLSIEPLNQYVLKVILDAKQPLTFKAGQYLQVVMSDQDKRPFSIASRPSHDTKIELHIGATPQNPYAYEVIELARRTGELKVEVGLGDAFLRNDTIPVIIIAGGTGYSYAKSILLDSLHTQPERHLHLYWGAKKQNDLYELETLTALASQYENFTFTPVIETVDESWEGSTGLVHEVVMADYSTLANNQVYVAGRFEMAAVIKTAFLPLGLCADALFGDAFTFLK